MYIYIELHNIWFSDYSLFFISSLLWQLYLQDISNSNCRRNSSIPSVPDFRCIFAFHFNDTRKESSCDYRFSSSKNSTFYGGILILRDDAAYYRWLVNRDIVHFVYIDYAYKFSFNMIFIMNCHYFYISLK